MASPLRAVLDIRRGERAFAALMFLQFFLVITSFWILKPLKKGQFIQHYETTGFGLAGWQFSGPEAELLAKVANMFVAFAAVTIFTLLARRLRRERLLLVFAAFFALGHAAYALAPGDPGGSVIWSFYLYGDLFSTLMVASFFAFLNDSVTKDEAGRLYGPVGLGGVLGGVVGTSMLRVFIDDVSRSGWLWICLGLVGAIAAAAFLAGRLVPTGEANAPAPSEPKPKGSSGNAALEGAALVLRSPYLLSIVAIVGLYEIVSTVMDFQFTSTIVHYLDGEAIGRRFATVFAITNGVSLVVQLLLTSFVMTRFGVGVALLVLPLAALSGSVAFLALPILFVGSALNTLDNSFSYSINQSAKEALYVPTTRDEKYKAKAFIDMFVQRFAKALAVGVSLGISAAFGSFESIRWLSLFTAAVIVLWLVAVRYAGRHYAESGGD